MKYLGRYETEFIECIGIIFAIILTVTIMLVMEGRSEKAFERLNQMKENNGMIDKRKTLLIIYSSK